MDSYGTSRSTNGAVMRMDLSVNSTWVPLKNATGSTDATIAMRIMIMNIGVPIRSPRNRIRSTTISAIVMMNPVRNLYESFMQSVPRCVLLTVLSHNRLYSI